MIYHYNYDPLTIYLFAPVVNGLNPIREEAIREHAAEDPERILNVLNIKQNKVITSAEKYSRTTDGQAHHRPWQVERAAQDSGKPLTRPW